MKRETGESTKRTDDERLAQQNIGRRRVLGGLAGATITGMSGCLGLFDTDVRAGSTPSSEDTSEYTTVQKTTTFSFGGTRTPFPSVEAIYEGEPSGTLVIAYFDYSHAASLAWWREEFPKLTDLIREGALRLTVLMFPKPVDRWSVMLPSALFEVRSRADREAAWVFHEGLVEADEYSMTLLEDLASQVGVDPEAVTTAAEDRRRRNQTFGDRAMGESSGVESLPAFRWGMDPIEGTSADDIRAFIEERNS